MRALTASLTMKWAARLLASSFLRFSAQCFQPVSYVLRPLPKCLSLKCNSLQACGRDLLFAWVDPVRLGRKYILPKGLT